MSCYRKKIKNDSSRNKSPVFFTTSSSNKTEFNAHTKSYADIHNKQYNESITAEIFKIRNPFSKRTTQLNITPETKNNKSQDHRIHPKTYTASIPSKNIEDTQKYNLKPKEEYEARLKKFQQTINPNRIEIPNEKHIESDASLDTILYQLKSDRHNTKSIEKLTDININLAKQLQSMKQQMEYIQLSQNLSQTNYKRKIKVILKIYTSQF